MLEDDGEIVEELRHVRIGARQRLLGNRQRASHQRLGLPEPALVDVHLGQHVERLGHLQIIRARVLLAQRKHLLEDILGFAVLAERRMQEGNIVQDGGIDLVVDAVPRFGGGFKLPGFDQGGGIVAFGGKLRHAPVDCLQVGLRDGRRRCECGQQGHQERRPCTLPKTSHPGLPLHSADATSV
jgi:hypothetical protein